MAIELVNLARFFERSNKGCRIQKTILRVNPAGKRFHAAKRFCNRSHNRLVINLDVILLYCLVDVVYDIVLQNEVITQIVIVIADMAIAIFLLQTTCDFRFLNGFQNGVVFIDLANTDVYVHRNLRNSFLDALTNTAQAFVDIIHVGDNGKMVIGKTAN